MIARSKLAWPGPRRMFRPVLPQSEQFPFACPARGSFGSCHRKSLGEFAEGPLIAVSLPQAYSQSCGSIRCQSEKGDVPHVYQVFLEGGPHSRQRFQLNRREPLRLQVLTKVASNRINPITLTSAGRQVKCNHFLLRLDTLRVSPDRGLPSSNIKCLRAFRPHAVPNMARRTPMTILGMMNGL